MKIKLAPEQKQRLNAERLSGPRWEYKTAGLTTADREGQLNAMGAAGWELINYAESENLAYFKRPVRSAASDAGNTEVAK
jgi:hypothetical protein